MPLYKKIVFILIVLILFTAPVAFATVIQFYSVPDADGYIVYWGQTSGGPYTHSQDVGLKTVVTFTELGITGYTGIWYFAVKAYNESGYSGYSDEIMYNFSANILGVTMSGIIIH